MLARGAQAGRLRIHALGPLGERGGTRAFGLFPEVTGLLIKGGGGVGLVAREAGTRVWPAGKIGWVRPSRSPIHAVRVSAEFGWQVAERKSFVRQVVVAGLCRHTRSPLRGAMGSQTYPLLPTLLSPCIFFLFLF